MALCRGVAVVPCSRTISRPSRPSVIPFAMFASARTVGSDEPSPAGSRIRAKTDGLSKLGRQNQAIEPSRATRSAEFAAASSP
jgi:hypothetical protein